MHAQNTHLPFQLKKLLLRAVRIPQKMLQLFIEGFDTSDGPNSIEVRYGHYRALIMQTISMFIAVLVTFVIWLAILQLLSIVRDSFHE